MLSKNTIIAILVFFTLSGWSSFFYQYRLQKSSEERIKKSVIEELENRKNIEDSIRSELESSNKAQIFIQQREFEVRMEETLDKRVNDYSKENEEYLKGIDSGLKSLLDEYEKKALQQSEQFKDYHDKLEEIKAQQAGFFQVDNKLEAKIKEISVKLEGHSQKEMELGKALDIYAGQLKEYREQQESFQKETLDTNKKLVELLEVNATSTAGSNKELKNN